MKASQGKIVVCFPFIGDVVGGSHLSALGLIRNLDRQRFKPLVVLHQENGPLADLLRREGVPFEAPAALLQMSLNTSRKSRNALCVLRTVLRAARFLRQSGVSIVHTNDGRIHVTWGLAGRLAGTKVLWHHRSDPTSFGLRYVSPFVANRVVAVSKFSSPRPGLLSAAYKCKVVHSPFDTRRSDSFDRVACRARLIGELGCTSDAYVLSYAGALISRKRPVLFVEVVAKVRQLAPDLEIAGVLYGESFESLDTEVATRAAELGISDRIHLMGFRYPVEPWLAAADVLVVTAVDEPLGRTLVEAMLLGTPVVASLSGGNPEAIQDQKTGILVRPNDPEAFAEAALRLIREPNLRYQIVRAAKQNASDRFGIEKHVRAITETYEAIAR